MCYLLLLFWTVKFIFDSFFKLIAFDFVHILSGVFSVYLKIPYMLKPYLLY